VRTFWDATEKTSAPPPRRAYFFRGGQNGTIERRVPSYVCREKRNWRKRSHHVEDLRMCDGNGSLGCSAQFAIAARRRNALPMSSLKDSNRLLQYNVNTRCQHPAHHGLAGVPAR
jgi:hypothetical protein